MRLEDLQPRCAVRGVHPDAAVTVVGVQWFGSDALELTYKTPEGAVANELLYRHDEDRLELVAGGRPWSFDGDGALFRLVSEAQRIRLAHLFDPVLAVRRLLEKLERVRQSLGGQVFDVLGKLEARCGARRRPRPGHPRVLFSVEHALQDGSVTRAGERRVISKRVLYVLAGAED